MFFICIFAFMKFDNKKFADDVFNKRTEDRTKTPTLRDIGSKIGVGYATLSRIERYGMPDLETYAKVCNWLNVSMDTYFVKPKSKSK